jgi:hypothetical protein
MNTTITIQYSVPRRDSDTLSGHKSPAINVKSYGIANGYLRVQIKSTLGFYYKTFTFGHLYCGPTCVTHMVPRV